MEKHSSNYRIEDDTNYTLPKNDEDYFSKMQENY